MFRFNATRGNRPAFHSSSRNSHRTKLAIESLESRLALAASVYAEIDDPNLVSTGSGGSIAHVQNTHGYAHAVYSTLYADSEVNLDSGTVGRANAQSPDATMFGDGYMAFNIRLTGTEAYAPVDVVDGVTELGARIVHIPYAGGGEVRHVGATWWRDNDFYDGGGDITGTVEFFQTQGGADPIYQGGTVMPYQDGDVFYVGSDIAFTGKWAKATVKGVPVVAPITNDPDDTTPPTVVDVVVTSSTTSDSYSFSNHDGSGDQLSPVAVRSADTITIEFSEDVYVSQDMLTLTGVGGQPDVASFTLDGDTATWTFDAPFDPDQYTITLSDFVFDGNFNSLDGDWDNPTNISDGSSDTFPSGDGNFSGDFIFDFNVGTPPKVQNVIIGSTVTNIYSTNPPYDFSVVVGSEEQLRTVPVGGANRVSVQFNRNVNISSSDLDLIPLNRVVSVPSVSSFVAPDVSNGYTATWTYSAALPSAQYALRIVDTVQDLDGNYLDGEWTNPGSILSSVTTSTFPSGNDISGGNFEFVFTILSGDANRDLKVDSNDYIIFSLNYPQSNKSWGQADFTGDGVVNANDYIQFSLGYSLNFENLTILGNYDSDFDIDGSDEVAFLDYYGNNDSSADLNHDSSVTSADYDLFYDLFSKGIDLQVV